MNAALRSWPDPCVAYRTRRLLDGEDPESPAMVALAGAARAHPHCDATIAGALRVRSHAYRKWQGPHWALVQLAERGHPGGDPLLKELQQAVFHWILSPGFLAPNRTRTLEGQSARVRHCGSLEGNLLWASVRLGIADDRLGELVARLSRFQWPDGGWNCDIRPTAQVSSFVETILTLRGLLAWVDATGDDDARQTLDRGLELVLDHALLYRRDGEVIVPDWGPQPDLIGFPIRFFDVLLVLELMAEAGRIGDPRCLRALDLLESKRTEDGGFPLEFRPAITSAQICSRCTFADWGPGGKTRMNPWITGNAVRVLRAAGRAE